MSLRVFCAVAELKGFTAAADRLGISLPMASKHVKRLEQRLGTCLLNRTRWQVTLTETGALYFEQIRQMLVRLDEMEAAIRGGGSILTASHCSFTEATAGGLQEQTLLQQRQRSGLKIPK